MLETMVAAIPILVAAAILAVASYLAERTWRLTGRWHGELVSLSAGVLATLLFLRFLPLFQIGVGRIGPILYIGALLGFTAYHIAEEWLWQHSGPAIRKRELNEWHATGFFIDHFLLGFALGLLWLLGVQHIALVTALPLFLFVLAAAPAILHARRQVGLGAAGEVVLAAAPLIGAAAALLLATAPITQYAIFAYMVGSLLYLIARDVMPKEREAKPLWFVIGAVIAALLLIVI